MSQRPATAASRSSTTNSRSHRSVRRGQPLADPSAAQPAARVIRTSPTVTPTLTGDEESTAATATKDPLPPVVLDAVVEKRKPRRKRNTKKLPSSSCRQNGSSVVPAFHDVPLGTFVSTGSCGGSSVAASQYQNNKNRAQGNGKNISTSNTDDDISKASDRILQGMSPVEIQNALHEVHTSLDSNKIAFLQQRRRNKKSQPKPTTARVQQAVSTDAASATTATPQTNTESMAGVLSSLQTYEDLDAAVESATVATSTIPSSLPDSIANSTNPFHVACHLLRSSSAPQVQWAARTVAKVLQQHSHASWTPPTGPSEPSFLLPVALRCLLDATTTTSPQTLAYAWHALDSLVQLTLCVSKERSIHRTILQHDGLCDVVVGTIPFTATAVTPLVDASPTAALEGAVYCTTSGNGSAQADAQSFWKDPLWTLLSRMRILPRSAQSLQQLQRHHSSLGRNDTTTIRITSILTRVAERSVGAATAIAQHTTLLPAVWRLSCTETTTTTNDAPCGWTLVHTLLRQSRYTARTLALWVVPRILEQCATATASASTAAALVAWRILFRYRWKNTATIEEDPKKTGVKGTEEEPEDDFTCEEALQDSRVLLTLAAPYLADATAATTAADWYAVLAVVPVDIWAFSSAQQKQALQQWRAVLGRLEDGGGDQHKDCWRLLAAVLQYVRSILQYQHNSNPDEIAVDRDAVGELLQLTIDSQAVQHCVQRLAPFIAVVDCVRVSSPTAPMETRPEASSCTAIATLLDILDHNSTERTFGDARNAAADLMLAALEQESIGTPCSQQSDPVTPEQVCWRIRLAKAVLLFLWRVEEAPERSKHAAPHRLREVSFILAGKLQEGDESTLAQLLAPGRMISTQTTISAVLKHRLEGSSSQAYAQMQHSHKLWRDSGSEREPLQCLLSRRSEGPKHNMPYESLLPLGQYWPWQLLAGDFGTSENPDDGELNPTSSTVLKSILTLIRELEHNSDLYARNLDTGPKLYYLANLCLIGPTGSVLGLGSYRALLDNLLSRYIPLFNGTSQVQFAEACRAHFAAAESESNKPVGGEYKEEGEVKAILRQSLPSEMERSLEIFINDLLKAHERGGVHSDIFIKILRLFLCHKIPTKARCQVLQYFRNSIHLLSIPEELLLERNAWYRNMLEGGLPSIDGSLKEAPDVLDCLASVYHSVSGCMLRTDDQFVYNWARMVFTRSLAVAKQSQSGIQLACARVLKLDRVLQLAVLSDLAVFLSSTQNLEDLLSLINTTRDNHDGASLLASDGASLAALLQGSASG